jgi:hypothetical protein
MENATTAADIPAIESPQILTSDPAQRAHAHVKETQC